MDNIEEIWNKGNEQISEDGAISDEFILNAISESSQSVTSKFVKTIWLPIVITILAIVMFIYNLFFYVNNTPVLIAITGLIILSVIIIILLIIQIHKLKIIDRKSNDLHNLLVKKIKHFNSYFQYVYHYYALSVVLATFTINLTIENADGIIELHKILILSLYYILVYIVLYYLLRKSSLIYIKRLKNALSNLEANSLSSIDEEENKNKKTRRIFMIIAILVLIVGLVAAYIKTSL